MFYNVILYMACGLRAVRARVRVNHTRGDDHEDQNIDPAAGGKLVSFLGFVWDDFWIYVCHVVGIG